MLPTVRPIILTTLVQLVLGGLPRFCSAQQYADDIARWTTQDALTPYEPGAVLFTGSSSIRRWEQLTRDFADYRVIQRGFGGSQFEDLNFYVDDIVLPYQPSAIVVWEGTNDLSSGEAAAEVFGDYTTFVGLVHAAQPNVEIFYLGVTPTLANSGSTAQRDAANALIEAEASLDARLHYIDLPSAFYALNPPSGPDFVDLYVDNVHLNRAGYDLWTSIVRPALLAEIAPDKSAAVNPDTLVAGERLLFDFGPSNPEDGDLTPSPDANGNHWNNWHPAEGNVAINAGERIGGLVSTTGRQTGVGLVITGGFLSNGKVNGGLLAPDAGDLGDLAIATATQDYFFFTADGLVGGGSDDTPGGFMLTGLDPSRAYDLRLFATRNSTQTRVTEYHVVGATEQTVSLQTSGTNIGSDGAYDGNNSEIALISGVRPNAFGEVFVDATLIQGSFGYVGLFELRVLGPAVASQPMATAVDAGGMLAMSASIEGGVSPEYRWYCDDVALLNDDRVTGADTDTLVIEPADFSDAGVYTLVVIDGSDSVETEGAIAGVRLSPLGGVDFNNDGSVDALDVLDIVEAVESAG